MERYLPNFEKCLQHEKPFCTSECPFHLEAYDFIDRIREGRFNAAYKAFRNACGFPAVAAELCDSPCRQACPLSAEGSEAIALNLLEKACIEYADKKEPTEYNLPQRKKRVAIIGAGISGMACALRLATKRFPVTIFEKSERIGGTLYEIMDSSVFLDDFDLQMKHLEYDLVTGREILGLDDIACDFDAVYVATGKGGNDFSSIDTAGGSHCRMFGSTPVYAGGSLVSDSKIHSLGDGLAIATAIDNYLMTGNLIYPEYAATQMVLDESRITPGPAVKPASGNTYSREEAVQESERCLRCQCDSCRIYCDLTEYAHKWPLRIRDEIIATTAPGSADIKATPAKRLINTCTFCGLCAETCPQDIDLGGLIMAARSKMHRLGKMPWVFNDFFLRDMDFSNSEKAYICLAPPDSGGKCRYAFFPGCQLGASDPQLVADSYRYLRAREKSTGIMLGCCGVPAKWAGDDEKHSEEITRIRTDWESLGRPVMITACPTCANNFREYLSEIKTVSLYELLAGWIDEKYPSRGSAGGYDPQKTYRIFDPCATGRDDRIRTSVRDICDRLSISRKALPVQEAHTNCCSYGGHGSIADPAFADMVREKRIHESDDPYIVYCINCRDAFLSKGKEVLHILDILFDRKPRLCTETKRRENRCELRDMLLNDYFGGAANYDQQRKAANNITVGSNSAAGSANDDAAGHTDNADRTGSANAAADKPANDILLDIDDELKAKISSQRLLENDLRDVVAFCERTKRSIHNTETDTFSGYKKIGHMTHWVEYKKTADTQRFKLVNAYSHRMEIELELIWNGEKIDTDMQ